MLSQVLHSILNGSIIGGGGGGGSMTGMIVMLVVLVGGGVAFFIYMKKKKGKKGNIPISTRQNKDEVWKSIKQFLKDNGEYGQEIVDSFVAKRNAKDYINPNEPKLIRKAKKQEIKEKEKEYKLLAKQNKQKGLPPPIKPKVHELYIVCFTTKDIKTQTLNKPRAIECEVLNTKISKKQYDRKIIINGEVNYEKEMEWIGPLRKIEHAKNMRAEKKRAQLILSERKRLEKMKLKAQKQQLKKARQESK